MRPVLFFFFSPGFIQEKGKKGTDQAAKHRLISENASAPAVSQKPPSPSGQFLTCRKKDLSFCKLPG